MKGEIMKKYCVAGYRGIIGSYILRGLLKHLPVAVDIQCFDIYDTEEDKLKRIKESDVIFNCVSFNHTMPFLEKYKEQLKGKIVVDQTSWKSEVYAWSKKNYDVKVYFMHILYNPETTPREDRQVVFFGNHMYHNWNDIFDTNIVSFISKGLEAFSIEIDEALDISISDHDKLMAHQQPEFYDMINNFIEQSWKIGADYETRNFKELIKIRNRIKKMKPDLKEGLYRNPYYKKRMGE